MRKKIFVAALISVATATAGLMGANPATAADKVSPADLQYVRSAMVKYNVPLASQTRLLNEYARGERWDSETDAKAVSTEVTQANGVETTIFRYADGSVNVSKIDIPSAAPTEGQVGTMAISGCQGYAKPGYNAWRNCKISWDGVSWAVTFTAAYSVALGPVYGCVIDSVSGLTHGGAGTFSNGKLEITNRTASGRTGECRAEGTWQQSSPVHSSTVGARVSVRSEWNGGRSSRIG